jgi:hypothetical protein
MLLREKLEDQAIKKVELERSLATKKLELMKQLQGKLAGVGRTDDRLDREIRTLEEQLAAATNESTNDAPKAKKLASLNVIKDGGGAGSRAAGTHAKARKQD